MHYFWPFFPTKAELSSCDRLHTKLKVFPNLFFFKHCHQSLRGDSIHLYDFSYFLALGGWHMLAHISLHSLHLLLNPVFLLHWLIEGLHGQLLACGGQRTICRSSFSPSTTWVPWIKRSGLWTISAAFLTHFQLNKSNATLNGISEGIHTKPKSNSISFLLCTTEGLEITLWSCTSGHATSCHLYFLALDSLSLCGPTSHVLSLYCTALNLSSGPAQVYFPQSNHTLISPVFRFWSECCSRASCHRSRCPEPEPLRVSPPVTLSWVGNADLFKQWTYQELSF